MKKQLTTILAVSAIALGLAACNSDRNLAPGTYESESSSVDANGTRVSKDNSTDVWVDSNGKKHVVKKTTTTKDPKGLLNKSSSTSESEKTYNQ